MQRRGLGQQAGRAGQVDSAAAFLERGRAQLLAENLSLGQLDLTQLARINPDLAQRYGAAGGLTRPLIAISSAEAASW